MPRTHTNRLCTIKLTSAERATLKRDGQITAHRPIDWPHAPHVPFFAEAYKDPGHTDLWGPGPYLKVPNQDPRDGETYIHRVFCPWGYPPRRVRLMRTTISLNITSIELTKSDSNHWQWLLTLKAT